MDGDPFGSYRHRFWILIRKSYKDFKKIFMEAGQGDKYIVLGTAGIGKSLFTLFWICYPATLKKKVVWKLSYGAYYLLDFSLEVAVAQGPVFNCTHPDLQSVFSDPSSWLIIDGKQKSSLPYECSMLLACSAKTSNYHEFSKHGKCQTYYLLVWAHAEIIEFYNDFEEFKFLGMYVPDKETALENFDRLGGVPRYVLDERNSKKGIQNMTNAIGKVNATNCLEILRGEYFKYVNDYLIHMFVDKETNYTRVERMFASSHAREDILEQFDKVGHLEAVRFLEAHIGSQVMGST